MGLSVILIVVGHTMQVWIWAVAVLWYEALQDLETAVYFALTSYTTLGYGDIVLRPELRIFAAMSTVTGLLTFGISTAYLISVIGRVLPRR